MNQETEIRVPQNALIFEIYNHVIANSYSAVGLQKSDRIEGTTKIRRYRAYGGSVNFTAIVEL